ncbi:MAG TPA: HD domain-containing phosphohydrolase [Blastocatellia bacterium]|nr:HD domain-containing phosphohydrolase [Blastocatellia bacterium]
MPNRIPRKVLWIDDDATTLQLGRIYLEKAGYSFLAAEDGEQGILVAEQEHPDLILLDYAMAGMSGKEVYEFLRSLGPEHHLYNLPVVMLTGLSHDDRERREMLRLGLSAFLFKPFGPRELLNVIDNVLITHEIRERNRLLERELQDTFTSMVRSLISLLSVKDPYTGEHSGVLLHLAERLARKCGLDDDEVFDVKVAALLHDIGKIGVPEAILRKPGRLTPEEKAEMDKHVIYGYCALADIPKFSRVRKLVYHHHEWWNGGGYPERLVGEQTPIGARIVAVVDAFDAMTSDRPYRRGMDQDIALERLHASSGTQFDPFVVEQFTACLREGIPGFERTANLNGIISMFQ